MTPIEPGAGGRGGVRRILERRTSPDQSVVSDPGIVALSSADAGLYGLLRASAEIWDFLLAHGWGLPMSGRIMGGQCSPRHRSAARAWQTPTWEHPLCVDKAARKESRYGKMHGTQRGADLYTKALNWQDIKRHPLRLSAEMSEGAKRYTGFECPGPQGMDPDGHWLGDHPRYVRLPDGPRNI